VTLPLETSAVKDEYARRALDNLAQQFPVIPRAPTFTAATLPSAATVGAGVIVFVSDGGAGAQARMSTGSAYINLG
jgi:hypothetical protein